MPLVINCCSTICTGKRNWGGRFGTTLTLFSLKGDLGPKDLLGKTLAVELDLPENPMVPNDGHRYFHGYVAHCARQGRHRHYHIYSAIVRPWIWLLAKTRQLSHLPEQDHSGDHQGSIPQTSTDGFQGIVDRYLCAAGLRGPVSGD